VALADVAQVAVEQRRSTLPVELDFALPERLPAPVEAAAY
jgi:hypothetical protein